MKRVYILCMMLRVGCAPKMAPRMEYVQRKMPQVDTYCTAQKKTVAPSVPELDASLAPTSKRSNEYIVFLDPGHGGDDPGAQRGRSVQEKMLTLDIAKKVEQYLRGFGYGIVMSRRGDMAVSLLRRVELATQSKARIFVSIHVNSAPNIAIQGTEIFYYHTKKLVERDRLSKRLGLAVLRRLSEIGQLPSRGVKLGNFCVIRETTMPSILVEPGFLSNSRDYKRLTTVTGVKK